MDTYMPWFIGSVSLFCLLLAINCQREDHTPEFTIPCAYLDGRLLNENDQIEMTSEPDECLSEGEFSIALSFPLTVSRWKAVRLQKPDEWDVAKTIVELECRNCDHSVRLTRKDLFDFGTVVLWQNPLLTAGYQAYYRLNDSLSCFQAGNAYTIDWLADNFPVADEENADEVLW